MSQLKINKTPLIKPINPVAKAMIVSRETNNKPQVIKNKKKQNDRKKFKQILKKRLDITV